jgi:hypothetical protein
VSALVVCRQPLLTYDRAETEGERKRKRKGRSEVYSTTVSNNSLLPTDGARSRGRGKWGPGVVVDDGSVRRIGTYALSEPRGPRMERKPDNRLIVSQGQDRTPMMWS